MNRKLFLLAINGFFFISCKNKTEVEKPIDTTIPVTLTTIDTTKIESYVELNATATYLVKTVIKANATGYLSAVKVATNDFVNSGKILFSLKTREANVLGNTINKIDPTLNFGSSINVRATSSGFVNAINVQQGNYVQDGDQLAIINDANSFGIVLGLPYELKKQVAIGNVYSVFLPDGKEEKATVQKFIPTVDAASQTQNVMLKIIGKHDLPENLIVKVRINKKNAAKSVSLPKSAVLTNETETDFWIMKMINADTAIKVPIKKGIETDSKVEILQPVLTSKDKILITGNYGVSDTIKVKIVGF